MIETRKEKQVHEEIFDYKSEQARLNLHNFNVKLEIK